MAVFICFLDSDVSKACESTEQTYQLLKILKLVMVPLMNYNSLYHQYMIGILKTFMIHYLEIYRVDYKILHERDLTLGGWERETEVQRHFNMDISH